MTEATAQMEFATDIGNILVRMGRITQKQLDAALEVQRSDGRRIGEVLVGMGYIAKEKLDEALAIQRDLRAPPDERTPLRGLARVWDSAWESFRENNARITELIEKA